MKLIKYKCDFVDTTITDVLKARGWTHAQDDDQDWHINWCETTKLKATMDAFELKPYQKLPHFRNHCELTRKNLLARNLKNLRKLHIRQNRPEEAAKCNIMPLTYELPNAYSAFLDDFKKNIGATWILKPVSGCQGRGIFLFNKLSELHEWQKELMADATATNLPRRTLVPPDGSLELPETHVAQRYIENPYLIEGKKFDLRIYVLVTSFNPLKVWMAREGFARICGTDYTLASFSDPRAHLTNMSIQLKPGSREASSAIGTKWPLSTLSQHLIIRHGCQMVQELMDDICDLVMTSIMSVKPMMLQDEHCFELYGYDVLIDNNLKPWLIEVNASPSLSATDPSDYRMKYDLLDDVLTIINVDGVLTGRETRVGGLDLIWHDGPVLACMRLPHDPLYDGNSAGSSTVSDEGLNLREDSSSDREGDMPEDLFRPVVRRKDALNSHLGDRNNRVQQLAQLAYQRYVVQLLDSLPSEEEDDSDVDLYAEPPLDSYVIELLNSISSDEEDDSNEDSNPEPGLDGDANKNNAWSFNPEKDHGMSSSPKQHRGMIFNTETSSNRSLNIEKDPAKSYNAEKDPGVDFNTEAGSNRSLNKEQDPVKSSNTKQDRGMSVNTEQGSNSSLNPETVSIMNTNKKIGPGKNLNPDSDLERDSNPEPSINTFSFEKPEPDYVGRPDPESGHIRTSNPKPSCNKYSIQRIVPEKSLQLEPGFKKHSNKKPGPVKGLHPEPCHVGRSNLKPSPVGRNSEQCSNKDSIIKKYPDKRLNPQLVPTKGSNTKPSLEKRSIQKPVRPTQEDSKAELPRMIRNSNTFSNLEPESGGNADHETGEKKMTEDDVKNKDNSAEKGKTEDVKEEYSEMQDRITIMKNKLRGLKF